LIFNRQSSKRPHPSSLPQNIGLSVTCISTVSTKWKDPLQTAKFSANMKTPNTTM